MLREVYNLKRSKRSFKVKKQLNRLNMINKCRININIRKNNLKINLNKKNKYIRRIKPNRKLKRRK